MNLFAEEPALIIAGIGGLVGAVLTLAIAFGAPITPDQKTALTTFIGIVVMIVTGWFIRGQVTAPANLPGPIPIPIPTTTPVPPAA